MGSMKIQTRLFNQQFLDVMHNLEGNKETNPTLADAKRHQNKKSVTDVADEEDARLLKQQNVNDSNLDYSELTKKVLIHCRQ